MENTKKYTIVAFAILAIILLASWSIWDTRHQFEYVYLNGEYYNVTNYSDEDNEPKEKVGVVTAKERLNFIKKTQREGASNRLQVGTELYKSLVNPDIIFYRDELINGKYVFKKAFKIKGDIVSGWRVYISL